MVKKMRKYYVRSGQLERLVIANTPVLAAEEALVQARGEYIDFYYIYIDERGFRGPTWEDPTFNTELIPEYVVKIDDIVKVIGEE